jgi:hypothetical protein
MPLGSVYLRRNAWAVFAQPDGVSKPEPVKLSRARAREIHGRKGRLVLGSRVSVGTVEGVPLGEGSYGVTLVDFDAGWVERRWYPELRLCRQTLELVVWL